MFADALTLAAGMQAAVKEAPKPIFRADYKPYPYSIDTVHLKFVLNEDVSHVTSTLKLKPNHSESSAPPLFLNGRPDVKLVSVKVAGELHAVTLCRGAACNTWPGHHCGKSQLYLIKWQFMAVVAACC